MSNHDYIIDNAVGATVRADINSALSAIATNNSSATEPATMYAYQWWADTTSGLLKQRNAANTAWLAKFVLSEGQLASYTPPTTWTATLTGTTASPTTPITTTGLYVKIGQYCLISCTFIDVDTTGATGDLIITGNPFTAGGTSMQYVGTACVNGFGTDPVDGSIIGGQTIIRIRSNITTVYTPIVAGTGKYLFVTIGFITT